MALAALMNACHGAEAGATTRSAAHTAGATAAALAAIVNTNSNTNSSSSSSSSSSVATQELAALVRSRHAGVLARLSSHLPALQLLCTSESVAVLAQALVRSAAIGGDLSGSNSSTITTTAAKLSDSALAAARDERDQLVRVTAAVARATSVTGASHVGGESLAALLVRSGAVGALLSFLPPARRDAISGCATQDTVALAPQWRAPAALAGNVCGALLHLLSDSPAGADVAAVVAQGGSVRSDAAGIEKLLCLFANSADGPVRKNAAICVARLAKVPELKVRIEALRGMEMLVQAGRTLV
jgi:hypothetical protein